MVMVMVMFSIGQEKIGFSFNELILHQLMEIKINKNKIIKPPLWCFTVVLVRCDFYSFVLHIYVLLRVPPEEEHRSIWALYSKSNFICFMPCNKPSEKWAHKLSVSRQIIKPQGQAAGFILDTISVCQWPFIFTVHRWKQTEICC